MTSKTYASVFDAIADTPQEAVNLRLRAELMHRIEKWIERKGWSQKEAAERSGVTQPRMNDLLRHRLSRFSLDVGSTGAKSFSSRNISPFGHAFVGVVMRAPFHGIVRPKLRVGDSWSCGHSMFVVRPRAIIENCILRRQVSGIGIQPGINIFWLDRNDAAIVSRDGNLGRRFVGNRGKR